MFSQQFKGLFGVTVIMILLFSNLGLSLTPNDSFSSVSVIRGKIDETTQQSQRKQSYDKQEKLSSSENLKIQILQSNPNNQSNQLGLEKSNVQKLNHDKSGFQPQTVQTTNVAEVRMQKNDLEEKIIENKIEMLKNAPKLKMASFQDLKTKETNLFQSHSSKKEVESVLSIFWRQILNQFSKSDGRKNDQISGKQNFDEKHKAETQSREVLFSSDEAIQSRRQKKKEFVLITLVFGILSLLFVKIAKLKEEAHEKRYKGKENSNCEQCENLYNDK